MKFHGEQRVFFLVTLSLVTIAFIAILLPFYSALLWAVILALLFSPLQRWLLARMGGRKNLATLTTLGVVMMLVILPVVGISMSIVREGTALFNRVRSGELNFGAYLGQIIDALPAWLKRLLDHQGLLDLPSLQQRLAESSSKIGQTLGSQAVEIGQNTVHVMASTGILLYVLFFLLRDARDMVPMIRRAIPLADDQTHHLVSKFSAVIKATVKGNVAVAAIQGALGGVILWFLGIQGAVLWAVVMAFLSLLPAVGAGLIWGPIAAYFLATGNVWQGVVLMLWGVFVIGLVDNVLRPVLVGKDTKMPDYVVLVSTVGGMSLFGLNGFVIGPLIAALFMATWDIYVSPDKVREEVREDGLVVDEHGNEAASHAHEAGHANGPRDEGS
ncbi:MAG: AI-2E family transporter [Lautropia sp.]|nr:AI-2E family transporter [Lautropia sp.]